MNNDRGINLSTSSILEAVAQMDAIGLHHFTNEVVKIFLGRNTDKQDRELPLLYQIYTIVPPHLKSRYNELSTLLQQETISPEERVEFLELNDQMEKYSAERLQLLMKLAKMREVSVAELMTQLGIQKPKYV